MANSILTINLITRKAVALWMNTNAFLAHIDTQYDEQFAQGGAKIGQTLRIRLPNDYTVSNGPALQLQDTQEQSTTLTVATQLNVAVAFTSVERAMSLDDYGRRVLAPGVNNLAGAVALNIMSGVEGGISNFVANQDPSNNLLSPIADTYLSALAVLDLASAPVADRKVVNDPRTEARMISKLAGLLNPVDSISKQYKTGRMYQGLGLDWMKDQTIIKHTNGTLAQGSATVNGANQTGLTLTVTATAGSLNAGDIITIAGVNKVNRITKQSTGELAQFVLTTAAPVGSTVLNIYPALIPPVGGNQVQYQTVTASPANGAAVNPTNTLAASVTYRKNFVFVPEAVTMVSADLELFSKGVIESARDRYKTISLRMLTAYLPGSDQAATRLDVLFGSLWVRPEWAVVVADVI